MILNPDCLREILLIIEEKGGINTILWMKDFQNNMPDYDFETIFYHLKLLNDENYIVGNVYISSGIVTAQIERMTMAGHKFLDNIRDLIVWGETKHTIFSKFKSVSISIIEQVAGAIIMKKLGS